MRMHFLSVLLICIAFILAALYLQHGLGLEPCPLCVLQRMVVILTGSLALVALIITTLIPFGKRFWAFLLMLAGGGSLGVAVYHVWLLHQPEQEQASCGPGLEVTLDNIIEYLPQGDWTEMLLRSSASCTDGEQKFFGLEVPDLALPFFAVYFIFLLWGLFRHYDD